MASMTASSDVDATVDVDAPLEPAPCLFQPAFSGHLDFHYLSHVTKKQQQEGEKGLSGL